VFSEWFLHCLIYLLLEVTLYVLGSVYDGFRAIMQYVQQFPEVEQDMRNFLIG
jgi:hypothetical protein